MSNTMRWRYGDTNPVLLPVASSTVIEIGDLVYQSSGAALPASSQSDQGSESANQEQFHDNFVGVAMQASPDGATTAIRVATSGVFEFAQASATVEVGELIGTTEASAGVLADQTVAGVSGENLAVGRCARRVNPADAKVLVDIVSTVMRGGPQAAA